MMTTRRLGAHLTVSPIGLGCMGMSFAYGGQDQETSIRTLRRAVEIGITFFDTAEAYGPFENERLLGRALKDCRDRVTIATKFGFKFAEEGTGAGRQIGLDSRPEHVKEVAEASLRRLGIDVIDLYYQHRVDPQVSIEETVGAMADLVKAGKVRALGLSEAAPTTIRRAHAVHPIAAVQSEYSLWTRDRERDVLPVCRELGIGFVPYAPLGRGFLTGEIRSQHGFGDADFRRTLPRFQSGAFEQNLALVDALQALARHKGVTAAQLALAWLLHQGDFIVPIPGARRIDHLEDNAKAADITLSATEIAAIETAVPQTAVVGDRYTEAMFRLVDR
jgi:aryl-alcohol dehydrogenase-like predicted oxidoreductase